LNISASQSAPKYSGDTLTHVQTRVFRERELGTDTRRFASNTAEAERRREGPVWQFSLFHLT
jgi:hypothetical protein